MMTGKKNAVARSTRTDVTPTEVEEFVPAVDVIEDGQSITLYADMPGVSASSLDVHIDRGSLTLRGMVNHPEGAGRPIYIESREGNYSRSFSLSDDLDTEGITASITDGVVRVNIPKAERAKPRRIDVKHA